MSTCGIFSYNNVGEKNMSTLEFKPIKKFKFDCSTIFIR